MIDIYAKTDQDLEFLIEKRQRQLDNDFFQKNLSGYTTAVHENLDDLELLIKHQCNPDHHIYRKIGEIRHRTDELSSNGKSLANFLKSNEKISTHYKDKVEVLYFDPITLGIIAVLAKLFFNFNKNKIKRHIRTLVQKIEKALLEIEKEIVKLWDMAVAFVKENEREINRILDGIWKMIKREITREIIRQLLIVIRTAF